MPWVIRLVAHGERPVDAWLKRYEPEASGSAGWITGWIATTATVEEAARFETREEAMRFFRLQSKSRLLREPNRPLGAFRIELEEVDA